MLPHRRVWGARALVNSDWARVKASVSSKRERNTERECRILAAVMGRPSQVGGGMEP